MVTTFLHSFAKSSVVKIVLALFLLVFLSCSDEFKRDTNLYVSVVGAGLLPSYHSGDADRETPKTLTVEVSQVVLVTADEMSNISSGSEPAALSMLTTEQKDVFEIFDREKRVYFKSLDDTLANVTYGRVEVYFKLYDSNGKSAFICQNESGGKASVFSGDVASVFVENISTGFRGCNGSGRLCYKSITDFSDPIESIGVRLDKTFTVTKTQDTRVIVSVHWKDLISTNGSLCEPPEFSLRIEQ